MRWTLSLLVLAALGLAGARALAEDAEAEPGDDKAPEAHEVKPTAPGAAAPMECRAPFPLNKKSKKLQGLLEKELTQHGFDKAIKKEILAVAVADLTKRGKPLYAGINDDKMFYSASLPKIAILLTVVNAVAEGDLEWTHEFDRRLLNMIVSSDNGDASWGAELVGLPAIEQVLRDPRYCLYDPEHGGLWVGRFYRGGGPENRDPLYGISHGASARQATRFYAMLEGGVLVDPHWSFRMMGLMSPPRHHHKFVAALQERPGVVFLARKSGTWRNYHSDSALIQHQGRIYALVAISEHKNGEEWMRDVARIVDDIIMDGAYRRSTPRTSARR